MTPDEITIEDLQLAYRVCDVLAPAFADDAVMSGVFQAAAELLRIGLKERYKLELPDIGGQATLL